MMLYRYLRPLPPRLPAPVQANIAGSPYLGYWQYDINGNYMSTISNPANTSYASFSQSFQFTTGGTPSFFPSATGCIASNQSYNYSTSAYVANINYTSTMSPTGVMGLGWSTNTGSSYGGTNYTDYLRLINTSVGQGGIGAGYYTYGQPNQPAAKWNSAGNAMFYIAGISGSSVNTALTMYYGGLTTTGAGGKFNSLKSFSYSNRRMFCACWLNATQFIVGFFSNNQYTGTITYDIYDITTQTAIYTGATGLPSSLSTQTTLPYMWGSFVALDSNRFALSFIGNVTGSTNLYSMGTYLLSYNNAGGFTTLDNDLMSANQTSNYAYPVYLGNNRLMVLTQFPAKQGSILYDVSGNTLSAKEFTWNRSEIFWAGVHQPSGNLVVVEYGGTGTVGTVSSQGVVSSFAVPDV